MKHTYFSKHTGAHKYCFVRSSLHTKQTIQPSKKGKPRTRKNLILLTVCSLFNIFIIHGQPGIPTYLKMNYKVIDTGKLEVKYDVKENIVKNVGDTTKDYKSDTLMLEIGEKCSRWHSYLTYVVDSIVTYSTSKPTPTGDLFLPQGGTLTEVFKNYPSGTYTCTDEIFINLLYTEPYPIKFNWKLLPDKKRFLGYSVQKATCNFRGRSYEAWFTPDIPISDGPWKFCGLPGLILELHDTEKDYVYTSIGIKRYKNNESIKIYNKKYKKVTREDYYKIIKNSIDNPKAFLQGMMKGAQVVTVPEENLPVTKNKAKTVYKEKKYNPIELY